MIAILYINQLNPLVTLKNSNLTPLIKPLKNKSKNPKYLAPDWRCFLYNFHKEENFNNILRQGTYFLYIRRKRLHIIKYDCCALILIPRTHEIFVNTL